MSWHEYVPIIIAALGLGGAGIAIPMRRRSKATTELAEDQPAEIATDRTKRGKAAESGPTSITKPGAKPGATRPDTAKPGSSRPDTAKPGTTRPGGAKPAVVPSPPITGVPTS